MCGHQSVWSCIFLSCARHPSATICWASWLNNSVGVLRTFVSSTYCPSFQDFWLPSIRPALSQMFTQSCSELSVECTSCQPSTGQAFAGLRAGLARAIKTFTSGDPRCPTFSTASLTFAQIWSFKNAKWGLIHEIDSWWCHPETLSSLSYSLSSFSFLFKKNL